MLYTLGILMRFEQDEKLARWLEEVVLTEGVFQWDRGNATKNVKHGVSQKEIESLFFGSFVLGGKIVEPHHIENRWILFGENTTGRRLTLIFTVRDDLIRPISCRPMRNEERKLYEEIIQGQSAH